MTNGWAEWQERRVADSQAEIGRIDYSWNGGDVIDFAERRRLKRVRTAEWVDGLGEGHAEGEKKEGGRMGCEGEEEGKAKGENWGEMEIREEAVMWQDINGTETDSEKDSETVKEKVWKEEEEDSFFKCLETMEKTEGQEDDVLNECKREQDDENDDDEVSRSSSEIYPEWIGSWKNVVMASRAQVGSPAYRAAEEQLSGTRLSYHREGQI
ncbi:hypothetical protein J4E91_007408 [Alternaria rosae]|nr:hypothetical protein J4E91_007408 [Alternaria rosae]